MQSGSGDQPPKSSSSTSSMLIKLAATPKTPERLPDKLTISLYSVETTTPPGYKIGFLNEFDNIKKIHDGLTAAAKKAGKEPPVLVLSVMLVPDWSISENRFSDPEYLKRKADFLKATQEKFKEIHDPDIHVEDFYSECPMNDDHRAYLNGLKALGSNADMIKTLAIVNNAEHCRHLQIDSNTVVPSFEDLYDKTFGADIQKDGINASYYDDFYISAHNKMVYTTPEGDLAKKGHLHSRLLDWCNAHKHDVPDKQPEKNSIYARVFSEALHDVSYVKSYELGSGKIRYPATLSPRVYWLTDCMVTAIQMSWSSTKLIDISEKLKSLPNIPIGDDGSFNLQCFTNVIKKHTGDLKAHSVMLGIQDFTALGEESRQRLLKLSNTELELLAVKQFFENTVQNHPSKAFELSRLFPDTDPGNVLTQKVFGCSVAHLQEQARTISISASPRSTAKVSDDSQGTKNKEEPSTDRHNPKI